MKVSEYRKAAKSQPETLHDVTLPSGFVWKLRTPPVQQFMLSGRLPKDLASKLVQIGKITDKAARQKAIAENLTPEELTQNLAFGRDLLLYCAVQPRIVIDADPNSEDEIAPEEIDPVDFDFLLAWVMKAGDPGKTLGNFRKKRR